MKLFNKKFILLSTLNLLFTTTVCAQDRRNDLVNPTKYLPTLTFQEGGFLKTSEKNFPIPINFNTHQDANGDDKLDPEDNMENMILFAIGENITGTGRTGLTNRGPNQQVPAVYFNYAETFSHNVYQYWYYYGENSHLENHEHDWESVFVFERDSIPVMVQLTSFGKLINHEWSKFQQDEGHIVLGVRRGDHSFITKPKNGVVIRYNGEIYAQQGVLKQGHGKTIPWTIFSSNNFTVNTIRFDETKTTKFYYGDIAYPRSGKELDSERKAPWRRRRWRRPRKNDK